MLVYSKIVNGAQHLFGTLGNLPSESDEQLIYKDKDGNVITLLANDIYLDFSSDGVQRIKRKSDNASVNVFIGTTQIIGDPITIKKAVKHEVIKKESKKDSDKK